MVKKLLILCSISFACTHSFASDKFTKEYKKFWSRRIASYYVRLMPIEDLHSLDICKESIYDGKIDLGFRFADLLYKCLKNKQSLLSSASNISVLPECINLGNHLKKFARTRPGMNDFYWQDEVPLTREIVIEIADYIQK